MAVTRADHERGLAMFMEKDYRRRFLVLLESGPRRKLRLGDQLPHFDHLDARYASRLPADRQNAADIAATLRQAGAPDRCLVVSAYPAWDGVEMALAPALTEIVGIRDGTFISCLPGQLAYFEGEGNNERFLLQRKFERSSG